MEQKEVSLQAMKDMQGRIKIKINHEDLNVFPYLSYEENFNEGYVKIAFYLKDANDFELVLFDDDKFAAILSHEEWTSLSKFIVYKKESRFKYFIPTKLFEDFLILKSGLKVNIKAIKSLEKTEENLKDFFQKLKKTYIDFVETMKIREASKERIRLNEQVAQLLRVKETTVTYDKGVLEIKKEKEGILLSYYDEKDQLTGYWFVNEKGKIEKSVSKGVPEKILQAIEEESQVALPSMINVICRKKAPIRIYNKR